MISMSAEMLKGQLKNLLYHLVALNQISTHVADKALVQYLGF